MIIEEGGKAVDGRPILQSEVPGIFDRVREILTGLGLTEDEFKFVGSAGKKKPEDMSGDIDVLVSRNRIYDILGCDKDTIYDAVIDYLRNLGYERFFKSTALKEISFGLPIDGPEDVVQVDLMFSNNLNWGSFIQTSPNYAKDESRYKNLYKVALIRSMCSVLFRKTTHAITLPDGEEIPDEVETYTLDSLNGLYKTRKDYRGKKPYSVVLKPTTMHDYDELVTDIPEDFVGLFFTDGRIDQFTSFESLYDLLMSDSFKFPERRDDIIEKFIEDLDGQKVDIPSELDSYVEVSRDMAAQKKQRHFDNKAKLDAYRKSLKEHRVLKYQDFIKTL